MTPRFSTPIKYNTPFVFHFRNTKRKPFERGGLTIVFDPSIRRFGLSFCSKKDNYNRKLGKDIALGRAKFCNNPRYFPKDMSQEFSEESMFVEKVRCIADSIAAYYGYYKIFVEKNKEQNQ